MAESSLIQTGITGLDEILMGGIPRGNVILLQGVTGKRKDSDGHGVYLPRHCPI